MEGEAGVNDELETDLNKLGSDNGDYSYRKF